MKKELYLVDENGEVIDTISSEDNYIKLAEGDRYIKLSDGDKVFRKGTIEYLSDSFDLKYHFVKINPTIFNMYCKKYSILSTLICNLGFMTNICEFKNGKKINMHSLAKICGVSYSTIKRQIKGMIEDDLLHIDKEGKNYTFILNPYLCMLGKRIELSLYEEFKSSSLRKYCEERNI